MISRLVKSYAKLSEAALDFRAQMVIINLTGNVDFPVTIPSIAEFTPVKEAYSLALQQCADGNRTAIALKNQAKADLLTMMRNLSTNVESLAQGDRAKLLSSGFSLASDGETLPPITGPVNLNITEGVNVGELKFRVKAVPGAVSYLHEYTEAPVTEESVWVSKISSSREHVFSNIRSGIRIYGRTAVIGRKGQEVYSNTLTKVVQ